MTKLSADHKNGEILRRPGLWSFECLTSIRNHSAPLDFSLLLYSPINEFNFGKGPHCLFLYFHNNNELLFLFMILIF